MLEGYLLYKALVVVFDTGDHKLLPLYLFGYGAPLAIAMVTLIVAVIMERNESEATKYHNSDYCFLSEHYIYYAFIAPVVIVLTFNTFILTKGVIITWKVKQL